MRGLTGFFLAVCLSSGLYAVDAQLPLELATLFHRLDDLGRSKVKDAEFVDIVLDDKSQPGWMISENAKEIVVLRDDLIPWTFTKSGTTRLPSSWRPIDVHLKSTKPRDFAIFCKDLAAKKENPDDARRALRGPGPSYRLLIAHAAWKKGLTSLCEQILAGEPGYLVDKEKFASDAFEDLAWLHFLRGVNLLMYADRREVLSHLRLAIEIAPESEHASAAKALLGPLERMVFEQRAVTKPVQSKPDSPTDGEKADQYVSQLVDLWCPQMSQPGFIEPYITLKGEEPTEDTPSIRLRDLGYAAVPALIKALTDDRPTRTVYHWRDFHHSRRVWLVSDFAWHILRDISKRELGAQRVTGFTFNSMEPEEKKAVIEEVRQWYQGTKKLSPDDRMMALFSSNRFEDWITPAKHFAAKKDRRPVAILMPRLKIVGDFNKGKLCELLADFGDPSAVPAIREVLVNGQEASDRIEAAIALWKLGDNSGIPIAIQYVTAEEQPYGSWDTPVWFLMRCRTKQAISTLKEIVEKSPPERSGEVIGFITASITGDLYSHKREPAGSAEVAEVLVAGMKRSEEYGGRRLKDNAAAAFVLLRDGTEERFSGRFVQTDPKVLDQAEMDLAKRDKQIEALLQWYAQNQDKANWDMKSRRLFVRSSSAPSSSRSAP